MTDTDEAPYENEVQELYNELKEMFIGKNTANVLMVLEAITGAVVCNGCVDKETAKYAVKEMAKGILAYIEYQDKNQTCSWNQKRH